MKKQLILLISSFAILAVSFVAYTGTQKEQVQSGQIERAITDETEGTIPESTIELPEVISIETKKIEAKGNNRVQFTLSGEVKELCEKYQCIAKLEVKDEEYREVAGSEINVNSAATNVFKIESENIWKQSPIVVIEVMNEKLLVAGSYRVTL